MLTDPDMKEIVDSFLVESKEILEKLDLDLVTLENKPKDTELLNEIFRAFHTIKGTSGFLGLEKLTLVTHKCEDLLNKLRKGEAELNSNLMDGILSGYDKIGELTDCIENNKSEDVEIDDTVNVLVGLLENLNNGNTADVKTPAKKKAVKKKSAPVKKKTAAVKKTPAKKTDSKKTTRRKKPIVKAQLENEADTDVLVEVLPEEFLIEETEILEDTHPVSEQTAEEKKSEEAMNNAAQKVMGNGKETTIRVDVERLDDLLNIVSEIVLGRNQLSQINSEFAMEYEGTKHSKDLFEATRLIDLMTNELQLVVMKVRMVKIGKVFNRFPRLVRDLSKETEKDIELKINGEETELDKTLIEEINDPLVHLIRNSVDHGIESPEEREKAEKPRAGKIVLDAEQEGNNIHITIADDGKGIDPEKIKNHAIKKGLITKEKADELTEKESFNLIFLPGFSTAAKVTNVSGRGVGMDVVKTNVAKLRGSIDIESELGKGTKITISLPLTLAIIHGMIVRVGKEKVVIPLNSILEVLRVHKKEVYKVNQKDVIKLRDMTLPLVSIDKILNISRNGDANCDYQNVVVVKIADKSFGVKVDELIGQKEVVIKSLGSYLGNLEGIAGSTIMGDGTVVMILDLSELMNQLTA
ncbi:MAG: chemotaxis protein CheA [Ignavibacteriae bacterium]|nr:chemotaxis protein CheA [Ignavibacteriota bacterium]NOG97127.1 chemotaxis protein CheA [Ignavibacteriota bacterium]